MKIAVVSDVHQSVFWKKIIDQKDSFDKIIFLGDEFDHWENEWPHQINNANDIIDFKKGNPDKVDLCWSNHAISYFLDERCSGYQSGHARDIKEFYRKHQDFYNPIYIYDGWIFSHAGVSAKWMKHCRINELGGINQMFREKPGLFRWVGPDNYGNNPSEGPLWIRPEALIANHVPKYNQVAGHTENDEPKIVRKYRQIFVFCDTYDHNYLTVLDTGTNDVKFIRVEGFNTPPFRALKKGIKPRIQTPI